MIKNMPNLREAQKRKQSKVRIIEDAFYIPDMMVGIGKGKKYHIVTYGCQANERDSETMKGILELLEYTNTDDFLEADIVLLNTCAVRDNAEQKVFGKVGALKNIKREKPDLIFGVCGCMAQEEKTVNEILQKYPHIDLVFGTHNIHELPKLLMETMHASETIVDVLSQEGHVFENLPSKRAHQTKGWINIMYGCDKFCTYCIVPYTRGKERSRLMEHILKEAQELKNLNYQEITLLGQNVNAYGKDLVDQDYDFALLLEKIAQIGIPRVRFMTSHPWDFTDEMIKVIGKYDNIMPFIHLPVQSGNNDVLKIMGRQYTVEQYLDLYNKLTKVKDDVSFSTDIIVGFPNETEEQFQDTLKIAEHVKYDNAFTFVYSPRAGTPASRMKDNVPLQEKKDRLQRLNAVVNKHMQAKNERFQDQIVPVLVEGPSKKNAEILSGYTPHQKLVNFAGDKDLIGQIVDVKITDVKTWSLGGELVG